LHLFFVLFRHRPIAMKRRARAQSIDQDLSEFDNLRLDLRAAKQAHDDCLISEQRDRQATAAAENTALRTVLRWAHDDTTAIALRARVAAPPQPPFVAAIGELFLNSRRDEATRVARRKEVRQQALTRSIAAHKKAVRKHQRTAQEQAAKDRDARGHDIQEARRSQQTRLDNARTALTDRKSKAAAAIHKNTAVGRRETASVEATLLTTHQQHVRSVRLQSTSPALFLRLPPLFAPGAKSSSAVMLAALRTEDGSSMS
jgi:hypothetical protein